MGTVLKTQGAISITVPAKSIPPRPAANERLIHVGDQLQTGPAASIDFAALPGILVHLGGDSDLLIEKLTLAKDGNDTLEEMKLREARLRLLRGSLLISVGRARTRSQVFVETPGGVLSAASGRVFRVEASGNKTRVVCVRRKMNFQPAAGGGAPVKIPAGYLAEWPAAVLAPQPAAKSGPRAQAEVIEGLKMEKQLRLLERQPPSAFAPGSL